MTDVTWRKFSRRIRGKTHLIYPRENRFYQCVRLLDHMAIILPRLHLYHLSLHGWSLNRTLQKVYRPVSLINHFLSLFLSFPQQGRQKIQFIMGHPGVMTAIITRICTFIIKEYAWRHEGKIKGRKEIHRPPSLKKYAKQLLILTSIHLVDVSLLDTPK